MIDDDSEFSVDANFSSESEFEDDVEIENIPPPAPKSRSKAAVKPLKKTSKSSAAAKKTKKVISLDDDDDDDIDQRSPVPLAERSLNKTSSNKDRVKGSNKSKTVEETYTKMSQLEHILKRPDTYIGSIERITQPMWVLENDEIVQKELTYTPGLYKIYDEILVNAADNKQRDPNMDKLEIEINSGNNLISVQNNGTGLPIHWHSEHECYVPTLVFGHLLTGSNFDDDEKKTTGGRNGYGAKLANIFSVEFKVECADSSRGKSFSQTFRNNMKDSDEPIIKNLSQAQIKKGDFVKISFRPDLTRFKMDALDEDTVQLLSKRAYDIAGSMANRPGKALTVTLNGKKLPIKKFENYLKLYKGIEPPVAYEMFDDRWEVGVGVSDGTFEQVSFVNAINTSKGGEHVIYIADQVAKHLSEVIAKKNKGGVNIKAAQIKNYINVFVNCLIENPSFDSQTKEFLTTKKSKFGSKCDLSPSFLKKIEKSDIVTKIIQFAKFKEKETLGKKGGKKVVRLTGITKLDDANFAGSAKSKDCTLILTEGDSAKSLAMSGLSVVGRDYYGVFPLKGKPLNVREATLSQVMKNEEIKNVVDIMGLKFGMEYNESNIKTLRYGHLMIMADQDHDGSHIKGLVINFIHTYWPSLLDVPGFLQQFITPIVKATMGKQSKTFFTMPQYYSWKLSTGNDAKGWKIKYYKGLGTSTSAEAKEYFSKLNRHEITFCNISADEVTSTINANQSFESDDVVPEKVVSGTELIEMAFSKKHVEERKIWLNNLKKDTFLDYSEAQIEGMKYSQFINKELILFSQADNIRSIPNIFDGFKPSQRKVLYGCFLRNLKSEMKVAQLSGYIGEKTAYHHGEVSLQGTIVNMAQDFVGSNNINLLTPSGQFGTRRLGGKDSASARYIFTKLEKITRAIFHPDDDALLHYLNEDGEAIEPEYYMPVIPMILVNGAEGIGTGWSTNIPNFDPRVIISNLRKKLRSEEMEKMQPFYYGFEGDIIPDATKAGSYIINGKIERVDDETLLITELPIKTWTQDYKQFLEKLMAGSDQKKSDDKKGTKKETEPEIKDFKENHTDTTVSFKITASKELLDEFEDKGGLLNKFKLTGKLSTSNMNVFDEHNRIIKFDSAEKILDYFYEVRLDFYVKRKDYLLDNMRRDQRILSNKARFIEEVCSGELIVSNRKRTDILADLKQREYEMFPKAGKNRQDTSEDEEEDEDSSDDELAKGYEYLLGMKIWSLTYEKALKLRQELEEKTRTVSELEITPPSAIWEADLDKIEEALNERDQYYKEAAEEELRSQKTAKRRQQKKKVTKSKKFDDELDSDEEFVVKETKKVVTKKVRNNVIKASQNVSNPKPKAKPATGKSSVHQKLVEKEKKKAPVYNLSDSDDDDIGTGMSLMDRLNKKTPGSALSNVLEEKANAKKRPSPRARTTEDTKDFESFEIEDFEPAALTPAPKKVKTAVAKKKTVIPMKSLKMQQSDDEDDIFEQKIDKKSCSSLKTSKPRQQRNKKVEKVLKEKEWSEEEEFKKDITDSDEDASFAPPPRRRAVRGTKKVKYQEDSDSDEDFDFDED